MNICNTGFFLKEKARQKLPYETATFSEQDNKCKSLKRGFPIRKVMLYPIFLSFRKKIIEGLAIDKLNVKYSFPWLNEESQQAKDIERFRWFSNGYIALSKLNSNQIIDIRYSTLPNKGDGLWGIELNPAAGKDSHIKMVTNRRSRSETYKQLWSIIVDE